MTKKTQYSGKLHFMVTNEMMKEIEERVVDLKISKSEVMRGLIGLGLGRVKCKKENREI